MLIIALVLAAIGLAALVFAVVTSNALVAWVCIGASLLGVLLLIMDALRERRGQGVGAAVSVADDTRTAVDDVDVDQDVLDDGAETAEAADDQAIGAETVEAQAFDDKAIGDETFGETAEKPAAQPAD